MLICVAVDKITVFKIQVLNGWVNDITRFKVPKRPIFCTFDILTKQVVKGYDLPTMRGCYITVEYGMYNRMISLLRIHITKSI